MRTGRTALERKTGRYQRPGRADATHTLGKLNDASPATDYSPVARPAAASPQLYEAAGLPIPAHSDSWQSRGAFAHRLRIPPGAGSYAALDGLSAVEGGGFLHPGLVAHFGCAALHQNFGLTSRHQPASDPRRECPERHKGTCALHGSNHEAAHVQSAGISFQQFGSTQGEHSN